MIYTVILKSVYPEKKIRLRESYMEKRGCETEKKWITA